MSLTTSGWLILIFPLAGAILIGLTSKLLPSRVHGVLGTLAIFLSFLCGGQHAAGAVGSRRGGAPGRLRGWDYARPSASMRRSRS